MQTHARQLKQFVLKPTVYCYHKCPYCDLRQDFYTGMVGERKQAMLRSRPARRGRGTPSILARSRTVPRRAAGDGARAQPGKFPDNSIFIDAQFNAGIRSYYTEMTEDQKIVWLDATLDPSELVELAQARVRCLLATAAAN